MAAAGFTVDAATSGAELLRLLADGIDVDVVLVDLDLGDGPTGVGVVNAIRDASPWVAVVSMSSHWAIAMVDQRNELPTDHVQFVVETDVRSVAELQATIDQAIENRAVARSAAGTEYRITRQQAEVLRLIATGRSSEEIARLRRSTSSRWNL